MDAPVVYDVLVGVRRGGPNPFYMDVIRALKKKVTPYEIAHTIVQVTCILQPSCPGRRLGPQEPIE